MSLYNTHTRRGGRKVQMSIIFTDGFDYHSDYPSKPVETNFLTTPDGNVDFRMPKDGYDVSLRFPAEQLLKPLTINLKVKDHEWHQLFIDLTGDALAVGLDGALELYRVRANGKLRNIRYEPMQFRLIPNTNAQETTVFSVYGIFQIVVRMATETTTPPTALIASHLSTFRPQNTTIAPLLQSADVSSPLQDLDLPSFVLGQ